MGRNAMRRWKFLFHRSFRNKDPPKEFICPISGSIMFEPVVVSSGQTYERASVQVCLQLGFTPPLPDGSLPNFAAVIPNLALKITILKWCDTVGINRPSAPHYSSLKDTIRTKMASMGLNVTVSEEDLPDNSRADFLSSASSEESVTANVEARIPLHPLSSRASCYSVSSSSSLAELFSDETLDPNCSSSEEEEQILHQLRSSDVFNQEQSMITLRKITRTNEEARVSLCTSRILKALRWALSSRYAKIQINAAAAIVNLSLEKVNKVKIVRSGIVSRLIDLLKGGLPESQEHAAGALFSLALENENKTAIGVLGALRPLVHALTSESERTRHDSALALFNLSLIQSNQVKLVNLGAVSTLLGKLKDGDLAGRVLLVLCNLATCGEGRLEMLQSNAVKCLVGMLRDELECESTRENCVAALYSLSQEKIKFNELGVEAGAAEVLEKAAEKGSERGREKAMSMVTELREREEKAVNWEMVLERARSWRGYRVKSNVYGGSKLELLDDHEFDSYD